MFVEGEERLSFDCIGAILAPPAAARAAADREREAEEDDEEKEEEREEKIESRVGGDRSLTNSNSSGGGRGRGGKVIGPPYFAILEDTVSYDLCSSLTFEGLLFLSSSSWSSL